MGYATHSHTFSPVQMKFVHHVHLKYNTTIKHYLFFTVFWVQKNEHKILEYVETSMKQISDSSMIFYIKFTAFTITFTIKYIIRIKIHIFVNKNILNEEINQILFHIMSFIEDMMINNSINILRYLHHLQQK